MKSYGSYDTNTGILEVNKKKNKSKRELADTVAHELTHRKHPKMKEKTVQKLNAPELSREQQNKLVAKLRNKKINYRTGAIKRKLKMKGKTQPGDMISKANENKPRLLNTNSPFSKKRLAILGLV